MMVLVLVLALVLALAALPTQDLPPRLRLVLRVVERFHEGVLHRLAT